MEALKRFTGWIDGYTEKLYFMVAYSLAKMGYKQEAIDEALDVLIYGNLGLFWKRFKENRLKIK